jgi:hypothetical protein
MRWSSSLFRQRRQVRHTVFFKATFYHFALSSLAAPFGDDRLDRVGTEIDRYACNRPGRAAGIAQCRSIVCRIGGW